MTESEKLIEQAEQDLLHTYNRYQIVMEKGDGVYLYDHEGNKYLDFVAGIAVFALGYNNKEYASMREGKGLEWFPEEYRKWLVQELTNHRRSRLKDLYSHLELINARFDVRRAEYKTLILTHHYALST